VKVEQVIHDLGAVQVHSEVIAVTPDGQEWEIGAVLRDPDGDRRRTGVGGTLQLRPRPLTLPAAVDRLLGLLDDSGKVTTPERWADAIAELRTARGPR
jgi:hypothetical protein